MSSKANIVLKLFKWIWDGTSSLLIGALVIAFGVGMVYSLGLIGIKYGYRLVSEDKSATFVEAFFLGLFGLVFIVLGLLFAWVFIRGSFNIGSFIKLLLNSAPSSRKRSSK